MTELDDFRSEKDRFMATDLQSPLQAEQKRMFKGLQYFPENPGLRLEVTIEPLLEQNIIQMQTSTGDIQEYIRYGKFKFMVDGQEAELTIYADSNGYFLPFVDGQAGKETYPAGRYLEPIDLGKRKFLIDFNYAYNPYCAYNDYWSCPLTPFENRLKAPIRAGEKIFHE
jgi:uncharacterized protein